MDTQKVWPDVDDQKLWTAVKDDIQQHYPDRFTEEHIRLSFSKACEQFSNYTTLDRICKRTRMNCIWERPIIPEAMREDRTP